MHVTTEIGVSYEFVLTAAVMIYEDRVHKREQFATIHKIAGEGPSGRPSLGAGSLLTTAFLRDLARGLERQPEAVLLPENVLAYTADLLIWWTPSRLRPMFFSDGAEDRAFLNGRIFPHPPLVWKVRRGELSIRALSPQRRPAGETPLMVARPDRKRPTFPRWLSGKRGFTTVGLLTQVASGNLPVMSTGSSVCGRNLRRITISRGDI